MKIQQVFFQKCVGGFFYDDQLAIKRGLTRNGFLYKGTPGTLGFARVRVPSESVSVMLVLENDDIALGDCCAVQYSGAGGRDPLFLIDDFIPWMEEHIASKLVGCDCSDFRQNAESFDTLKTKEGKPIHTAIRYGVTQALLDAAARSAHCTIAEVVTREYGIQLAPKSVRIFAQSGDERHINADKMILKGVDVLPHGLINNPNTEIGSRGEKLAEFIIWLRKRILQLRRDESYNPELHFDVYGMLGIVFRNALPRIVDYLAELEEAAAPFALRIEAPVDAGSRQGQVEVMKRLCELIKAKGAAIEIVADEWCNSLEDIELFADERAGHMLQIKTPDLGGINNTIEAVISCKAKGVKAYQGGSCTETDISARICTQVAIATQPYQVLAKPGMGVDEGFMIVKNEMARTIALLRKRVSKS